MAKLTWRRKLRSTLYVSLSGLGAYCIFSFYKNEPSFYKNAVMPLVHLLDAEGAHRLGVLAAKYRLIPKTNYIDPDILKIKVFGKVFPNPIGIAAGFDKDGEAIIGLNDMGFGFVEIGSVTPEPQPGNDKPRVFRLAEDQAIINRYGFNSQGHGQVFQRLKEVRDSGVNVGVIGVNLGRNRNSYEPVNDFVAGINKFAPLADYLVINISSPNTPGLRTMQNKNALIALLKAVVTARNNLPPNQRPALLLKLTSDLNQKERKDIAAVITQKQAGIDGLIISNTTTARPEFLINKQLAEELGGLSGGPLKDASTEMIADMYKLTNGTIPIIGVGGIFTGKDAFDKIKAGASIVQLYTSIVYEGPPVVAKIKKDLCQLLTEDGYSSVAEAVGKDARVSQNQIKKYLFS